MESKTYVFDRVLSDHYHLHFEGSDSIIGVRILVEIHDVEYPMESTTRFERFS
jgi:hypothetical protein